MTFRVLLIEDEPTLIDTISYNLKREGYDVVAERDGERGLHTALNGAPGLVLLDLLLPKLDGLEVCRQLSRSSNVPVIMLTARDEEMDRVLGLEMGADDYIGKPFSMRELMARVKAMLCRQAAPQPPPSSTLRVGDFEQDESRHEIRQRGQPLTLTPLEYKLLAFLLRHRGATFSREALLEKVWGYDFAGDTRTVDVHVRSLRTKIEAVPGSPVQLITVRGVGYRLDVD